ncbi:MAG TPA: hypothetical protein VHQ46_00115 [Desulfobacteria bacterium]|nr:hypothetical protein [Desulfobacteria bacterium]
MATGLAKKLFLVKSEQALLINQPEGYIDRLKSEVPDKTILMAESPEKVDFVHLFVKNSEELKRLFGLALKCLKTDAFFWVSYPKKSGKLKSDLSRDSLVSLLHEQGYEGVSLISIDDTWSAMRVRPMEKK